MSKLKMPEEWNIYILVYNGVAVSEILFSEYESHSYI